MRGQRALIAEVLLGLNNTYSEQPRPEAVHRHPRGQRIVFGDQPFRQTQPVARSILAGTAGNAAGTPASTTSPGSRKLPRSSRCVVRRWSGGNLAHDQRRRVLVDLELRRVFEAIGIGGLIEKCVKLIELLLRNRVVLVVVALRAAPGQPHPDLAGRRHAVFDGEIAELFVVGAALVVGHRVAMKARRDQVVAG